MAERFSEARLEHKLRAIDELLSRPTTDGEHVAASRARQRIAARLAECRKRSMDGAADRTAERLFEILCVGMAKWWWYGLDYSQDDER